MTDVAPAPSEPSRRRKPGLPWGWVTFLGVWLVGLFVVLLYLLVEIWPAVHAPRGGGATKVEFFGDDPSVQLSPDGALLLLAVFAGALGSLLHAMISFADYVGNRTFRARWTWWYVMRAPAGALLALIFYVAIRAGFLTTTESDAVNAYGIATFSGLAGLFAKQALDKLEQVFTVIFGSKDEARADSLTLPSPEITAVEPQRVARFSAEVLVIRGTGFTQQSKVRIGTDVDTEGRILEGRVTYHGAEELRVTLDDQAVAEAGVLYVTVVNPEPGGGISGPYEVEIFEDGNGGGGAPPPTAPAGEVELPVEEVAEETETVAETAEAAEGDGSR